MLQMNCPKCDGVIQSPLLAEISAVKCGQCRETVPVQDVYVATKGFIMHREDLLKRIFRYQTLLKEVETEMLLMENESVSEATRKSLHQFHATVLELLAGSRKNFRLEIPFDLSIELDFSKNKMKGRLRNLSSEGASIELGREEKLPQMRSAVRFELPLPDVSQPLTIRGKVVWARRPQTDQDSQVATIGVNFVKLDEGVHSCLWNFIVNSLRSSHPDSSPTVHSEPVWNPSAAKSSLLKKR